MRVFEAPVTPIGVRVANEWTPEADAVREETTNSEVHAQVIPRVGSGHLWKTDLLKSRHIERDAFAREDGCLLVPGPVREEKRG